MQILRALLLLALAGARVAQAPAAGPEVRSPQLRECGAEGHKQHKLRKPQILCFEMY